MALSPVDFYAYSRATGAPIPEDPEERAQMAPEVLEFRRNQLRAPQQESNPLATLGTAALGLGALLGAGFGARALMGRGRQIPKGPAKSATAGVRQVNLADMEEAVRRAAKEPAPSTPPPPPSIPAVAPATVDISKQTPTERMVRRHGRMVPASSVQRTAIPQSTVDIADELIQRYKEDYERAAPFQYGAELSRQSRIAKQNEQLVDNLLNEIRAEPAKQTIPLDVDKFLEENETLYRRLVSAEDVKEKRVLGAEFLEQLRSGQGPVIEAPSTPLPTRAIQPGSFSELTDIQNQLLNQARNEQARVQQVNAVESGEDQVAQRARRKTMALSGVRAGRREPSPALQKLYEAGLDDFEVNARINAYAQYGKEEFLDPGYNANTVGAQNFARTLDIVQPEFDRSGNLIAGEFAGGQRTVYAGKETYETLPEGEIRRSAFASQQPKPIRTRSQDEEQWEPISQALTGLTGGVSTAAVPMAQSEQYETAINNFRSYWDEQVRSHLAGNQSFITRPARRNRIVDEFDLDMPVRLQKVEGLNEAGELVSRTETILYRDVLPPDTVEAIQRGERMNLDVPFLVDKNRAIAVAEANPTIENRLDAEHYKMTGRALVRAHQKIVTPYVADKYIAETTQQPYFQLVENLGGEPDVTPSFGRGSQKGRLVGGTAEPAGREPVYDLYYGTYKKASGDEILINKTMVPTESGELMEINIPTLRKLDQLGVAKDPTGAELYVSPAQQREYIMTQPMSVKRPFGSQPIAQIRKQGISSKTGEPYDFLSDVYEAAETIVQAPLQVLNANTGEPISSLAQIKRDELSGFLKGLKDSTGIKDYSELGKIANRYLAEQKGITLPVLDSPTAFEFIENVIGRPRSRPARKSFVTVNERTGEVYNLSREEAQSLGFSGGSVVEPRLARKTVGPPSLDIRESPKSLEDWARMGESDIDWEQRKDFGDEPLGVASMGPLLPRRPGELQRSLQPATTGAGSELQALREELAKIKATEPRVSSEPLPSNLEVVTQQLMAQAGRRAGKRRNR